MANGVNIVTLIGNLGADPETRTLGNGNLLCNLRIATGESWRDKSTGERKERTEWHRVVIFNEALAKVAEQYLRKGSLVYIQGKLRTRKWTDQSGVEKFATEVVLENFDGKLTMLGSRNAGGGGGGDDFGSAPSRGSSVSGRSRNADMDDDIPF